MLPDWAILFNATLLVLFSGFCFAVAVRRDLRPGQDAPQRSDVWRPPKALLVVVNGGLLLVSLGALLGVWFGRTGGTWRPTLPPRSPEANRAAPGAFILPAAGAAAERWPRRARGGRRRSARTSLPSAATPRRSALGAGLSALGAGPVPAASAQGAAPAGHVVLLGDSVFDNAGHLAGRGPDVTSQLRARLPAGWRATLLARGGSVAADVPGQLGRLPPDATHLVISAGGNDAGRREGVLAEPARSVAEGLAKIASVRDRFAGDYRAMLDAVSARRRLPTAVCTVYDPRFADPNRRRVAVVALAAFNDVVTREAFARGLALIDLRLVSSSDEDFADATGPSARGGAKIAAAIAGWTAGDGPARRRRPEVFVGGEGG